MMKGLIKIAQHTIRTIKVSCLSRFLLMLLHLRQIPNAHIAIAPEPVYINPAPGSIPGHLSALYRDTRSPHVRSCHDGKNACHTLLATGTISWLKYQDQWPDGFVGKHLLTLLPCRYSKCIQ
jgi:hypothetical protein